MATQRWNIDPSHSGIHFTVRHMVIAKVRGAFERWQGTVDFDAVNPTASKVEVEIDTASVDTREPKRDEHLRSSDFLDVAKFPKMTFSSTKIEKVEDGVFRVLGDFTLHGVTLPVTLETELLGTVKDPWGNERLAFQARAVLNRKDFGLGWNQVLEAGGVLVGEKIDIALDVQAVKARAAADAAA
jgi:polyisoprenoid-binding protein YceI